MRATVCASVLLAVLLPAAAARAQCRVEGVVQSLSNEPIAGATVQIEGPDLQKPVSTTTGPDGRYRFDDVRPGIRVQVTARQNGRTLARAFTLVTLAVETVNLQARPESFTLNSVDDLDPEGGPSGEIRGIVRGSGGQTLSGARVGIDETDVETTTDAAGRYAIGGLRSGLLVRLTAAAAGFTGGSAEVSVPNNDRAETDFTLEPATDETRVEDRIVAIAADGSGTEVRPSQAAVPSFARGDLFRAVQFLPGTMGSLDDPLELHVRGGAADQTLIALDGFTIYPYSHLSSVFGNVNMDAVRNADFFGDTSNAAVGGRLGGALRLTGESGGGGRPSAIVDASMLGLATRVSFPIASRGSFLLAARRSPPASLYDDLLNQWYGQDVAYARDRGVRFSGGPLVSSPESGFQDVNGKLDVSVAPRDRVSLTFYEGRDVANLSHDGVVPPPLSDLGAPDALALPANTAWQLGETSTWTGRGLSAMWRRRWSSDATTTVSVGRSEFSIARDQSSALTSASTGADMSLLDNRGGSNALAESNHIDDTTVRLDNSIALGFAHVVSVGGEVVAVDTAYDLRRETVRPAATGLLTSALSDLLLQNASARTTTAYVQDAWRPIGRLVVSPGVRVSRYDLAASTFLEPRVNAAFDVGPWVRLTGGWAIDHQTANRIVREDLLQGDGEFWALSDGSTIPVARAQQVGAGGSVELPGFRLDARGYYKRFDDLTMFAPRLFPGVTPTDTAAFFQHGSGRAFGLHFSMQQTARWNSLWMTYAAGRVEYTYPALEASTFPASFDQTHELKIMDAVRHGAWTLSAMWMFGSGRPETPAQSVGPVWFPSGDTVYQVVFGAKNSVRLPPYHRLDASAERAFRLQAVTTTLGATIFNAYNQQNIAYREYGVAGTSVAANDIASIGRAVDVFVRVGF